ncbi:MAG TPA: hypothetical protein DCX67_06980 [Opitutae bacterium]|nr:hypothetical protein [Opitutae bacterium]|tara:strand:- start:881 stop:1681 length:801 start_codon:yes stop_codon:yes gene_type:complete
MKILLLALAGLCVCPSSWSRVFTSSDGVRKIEATLVAFDEKSQIVSIQRSDGRPFHSKITAFSESDQAYVRKWMEGTKENYLYVGREYPGHLQMFLKILNAGGVGYGQTILYGPNHPPIAIGNGPTPFLAWVDGYDRLGQTYDRFNATQVSFDLVKDNWQARIAFQAGRSVTTNTGVTYLPSGNLYGVSTVAGPILYQQPQRIVILGENQANNQVLVVPRGPAPVFVNPFGRGGARVSGLGVSGAGLSTSARTSSRGRGISVRINR